MNLLWNTTQCLILTIPGQRANHIANCIIVFAGESCDDIVYIILHGSIYSIGVYKIFLHA